VTIKVGTVLKAVAVDFHAPVKEWMEVLAKKLLINDIEDYTLILNPPNMHCTLSCLSLSLSLCCLSVAACGCLRSFSLSLYQYIFMYYVSVSVRME
jgi:hypothetical protein